MRWAIAFSLFVTSCLFADIDDDDFHEAFPSAVSSLAVDSFENVSDGYLEGYVQALVDMHYYEAGVLVSVRDHVVTLSHLPHNAQNERSIISFVRGLPGVKKVEVEKGHHHLTEKEKTVDKPTIGGIWFPQATVLFLPLLADFREPIYWAAYRFGDHIIGKTAAAVSIGDTFPIYRWLDIFLHGDMQIDIEACAFAVFNFDHVPRQARRHHEWCELVNTDYLLGIRLSYAKSEWSYRLRVYHISSHLGDEYLCNHQKCSKRKNPSYEAVEFIPSYQFVRALRGYIGPGVILESDQSFNMKWVYFKYGAELRLFGQILDYHRLYATPFLAVDVENWEARGWDFNVTVKLGYELSKLQGVGRKMRVYVDYNYGYSPDGQFFKKRDQFGEVGFSWGF